MNTIFSRNIIVLFLLCLKSIFCVAQPSGSCGTNLSWVLDYTVLTIKGNGSMENYYPAFPVNSPPEWKPYESIIKKIIVEDGVETIGNYAFAGLNNLDTVILGKDVHTIGERSFAECVKLAKINFPSKLKQIKDYAFYASRLDSISLPDNISIGNNAFQNSKMVYLNVSGTIGDHAFRDNMNLKTVVIRGGTIGKWAFHECENLDALEIQNGVTEIGYMAFYRCEKLKKVTIPSSVVKIGEAAFYLCKGLEDIDIAAKIIEPEAFYYCNIPSIILREGVDSIKRGAFLFTSDFQLLDTLFLPSTLSFLHPNTFFTWNNSISFGVHAGNQFFSSDGGILFNKNKTTLLSFPSKKTGHYALPGTVEKLREYAFSGNKLTSIDIPLSVKEIGDYAFFYSRNLRHVNIPESVIMAGSGFFASSSIETINLPKSLKSIPEWAFHNCNELTAVHISEGITSIEKEAFSTCAKLKSIHFPASVEVYKNGILTWCTGLDSIKVSRVYPAPITADVFSGIDITKLTLVVSTGSKILYDIANVWKNFGKIVESSSLANEQFPDSGFFRVFPNPVDDYLIVECDDCFIGKDLSIFSINGTNFYSKKVAGNKTEINLSSFPKGIYIVSINGISIKTIKK